MLDGRRCNSLELEMDSFLVSEGSSGMGSLGWEWAVNGSRFAETMVVDSFVRLCNVCMAPE
jgi:hypothetical protein